MKAGMPHIQKRTFTVKPGMPNFISNEAKSANRRDDLRAKDPSNPKIPDLNKVGMRTSKKQHSILGPVISGKYQTK